nr:hypothetical protein YXRTKSLT_YXRTKSLT_CDS_0006 [uncultured phage]CAI9752432.1 hypothetical protein IPSYOLDY_IPSYOLDY_CDS_0006 [uncultured phage]
MKTEQILNLDYRKEESQEIIQKVLRKIKPLSKYSDESNIPIEAIEKLVRVLVQKYEITPQWMSMSYFEPILGIYSIGVKTTTDHKWLGTVYGMCLYEVFAKLAIKMYSEVKAGNIPVRTMTKEEKQRERLAKQADAKMAKDDDDEDWS